MINLATNTETTSINDIDNNLKRLYSLRDDYRDEIPPIVIHSVDVPNNFKCRVGWFANVQIEFALLEMLKLIDTSKTEEHKRIMEGYREHIKKYEDEDYLTKLSEYIQLVNQLLTKTIGHLEGMLES